VAVAVAEGEPDAVADPETVRSAVAEALPLPETDRKIILPLMRRTEPPTPGGMPGFFAVHIDCRGAEMTWTVEQEVPGVG
jgi:hypothetical protein